LVFRINLMRDPVIAADGFTYERASIEQWMETHDVSPRTSEPFKHTFLTTNFMARQLIASWCEQNDVPVPSGPIPDAKPAPLGGGAAAAAELQLKPLVTCVAHPKEQLRVFCNDCGHGVCLLCAVDTKRCKSHATEVLETFLEDLTADREGWVQAHENCRRSIEQLCTSIQADADAKKQAIDTEAAALLQQVRAAVDERATALGAIAEKRQQREELVFAAAASPELGLKHSAAAATIAAAVNRFRAPVPAAPAAEFRSAAAPATAVGQIVVFATAVDLEDEDARKAAAEAAALTVAVQSLGSLGCSAILGRVHDRNKVTQFEALLKTKLQHKSYRLLYTWSRDGKTNASFHQNCDNQVRAHRIPPRAFISPPTASAGPHSRHPSLDHWTHLWRLRCCIMDLCRRLLQLFPMLPVSGRESDGGRTHVL